MGRALSKQEEKYRLDHIDNWRSQKVSMRSYALENQLNYGSFKNWCYQWKKANGIAIAPMKGSDKFIPIKLADNKSKADKVVMPPSDGLPRFELKLFFGLLHFRIG